MDELKNKTGKQELAASSGNLLQTITSTPPSELIKPLQNTIFLFDSFVAGTSHLKDRSVLEEMKTGDTLTMQREDNAFDSYAILLKDSKGRKAGYIPAKDNIVFARLMDAGKLLSAEVKEIEPGHHFWKISIGISLTDF